MVIAYASCLTVKERPADRRRRTEGTIAPIGVWADLDGAVLAKVATPATPAQTQRRARLGCGPFVTITTTATTAKQGGRRHGTP